MATPAKIVVDEVIAALIARPNTFTCGECTLTDIRGGNTFWIANGWLFAGLHAPYKMRFGLWQGFRFHRALAAWKAWDAARRLRLTATG